MPAEPAKTATPSAIEALDICDIALVKLDKTCCDPGRSPRMITLANTLSEARDLLALAGADSHAADAAIERLESAGAQVGQLQVGCCAPTRMPLYADILAGLMNAQLRLNASLGLGH